jgi:CRISPR system Cascade subunit CasA
VKYDLLTEPWLPALTVDGRPVQVGLLELFARAHELKTLVLETPDVTSGVYRMLLAILHRAYDGPRDLSQWRKIWAGKRFDTVRTEAYLSKWCDRFDLWDPKHPFQQDPSPPLDEFDSVSRLFFEKAQGNNPTLFDHTTDEDRRTIDASSAARRLLGVQVMSLGGRIPGASASALAGLFATSVTFLFFGETLFESLMLNLLVNDGKRPIPSNQSDAPSWEFPVAEAEERAPNGYLELLTWRPRRYRLVPADAQGTSVAGVVPAGEASRYQTEKVRDPYAAYRVSKEKGFLPLKVDIERALWRDSLPFFAGEGEWGLPPLNVSQVATLVASGDLDRGRLFKLVACGFATDQQRKHLGRIETIPIPAALLATAGAIPVIRSALDRATEVDRAFKTAAFLAARHSLSTGERSPDTEEVSKLAEATGARPVYWAEAGAAFPKLLLDLAAARPDAELAWEQALTKAARRAFDTVEVKLGAAARGLKAVTIGRAALHQRLAEVFPKPESLEEANPA